jgi:hypothetical protein
MQWTMSIDQHFLQQEEAMRSAKNSAMKAGLINGFARELNDRLEQRGKELSKKSDLIMKRPGSVIVQVKPCRFAEACLFIYVGLGRRAENSQQRWRKGSELSSKRFRRRRLR